MNYYNFIDYFLKLGITLTPLSNNEKLEFKQKWVNSYTRNRAMAKNALTYYLWHVFSFEDKIAIEGDEAMSCFDNVAKDKVLIFFYIINALFEAQISDKLSSAEIERMCSDEFDFGNMDVIVTAEDFSWTYCRTHERGWFGPYFYQK